MHIKDRPESCHVCENKFQSKSNKKIMHPHIALKESKLTNCKVCKKLCKNEYALKIHMISHSTERSFACDKCAQTFKSKLSLKIHLNSHDGLKLFTCEKCGKELGTKQALKWHMHLHTDLKPLSCSFCAKQFISPSNLQGHEKRHRDGSLKVYVRNIHCNQCKKAYCGARGLRRHKAEAHGEDKSI